MTPVVEIFGETRWGYGTVFSNFLLTAQHVIEPACGSVIVNDFTIPLFGYKVNNVNPEAEDSKLYDFAIFKSDIPFNNLSLYPMYPEIGQHIEYYTIRNGVQIVIKGMVVEIIDYFIHCKFDAPIKEVECGSPIIAGNHILGILNLGVVAGESPDCYFQSSASIVEYLNREHPGFLSN